MLRSLGFSLVRPQTLPGKGRADEAAGAAYKKLDELRKDEVHFQITTSVTWK